MIDGCVHAMLIIGFESDMNRSRSGIEEEFLVNVMGVQWTTREFIPLLEKSKLKKVANM